jgi:hypothetical protein
MTIAVQSLGLVMALKIVQIKHMVVTLPAMIVMEVTVLNLIARQHVKTP